MKAEELGAWQALLQEEFEKPYWQTISERVDTAYAASAVYPPREALFAAFRLTPPEAVRAVILGQDPYHEPGQANGLAFSVNPGVKLPPSLRNLFTELQSDCGITPPDSGDLTAWAKQGVFLLNSSLTVEAGKAASHKDFGWQTFTDAVVQRLAALPQPVPQFHHAEAGVPAAHVPDQLQLCLCMLVRVAVGPPGLAGQGFHGSIPARLPEVNI